MDAKKRGVEVTEPGRPLVIDVEPLEIIDAPPAAAIRPIGSAVARRAASPAADPVLFVGEHPVDRRRRLDAERKRRSRAQQRETATATRRRRRFAVAAALIAIPCFAVAAAAFTYDRWSSTSAEVAEVGAAVDAVGSDVRRVGGTLSASMAGLGLSVAGVEEALADVSGQLAAIPDTRPDLDRIAETADGLDRRIGTPAQATQVDSVLAAANAIGSRVDLLSMQVAALDKKVRLAPPAAMAAAAPIPLTPPADCVPSDDRDWWARQGEHLETTLRRWAAKACWSLVWKIHGFYEWEVDARFTDEEMRDAVRAALRAFQRAPVRPVGEAFPDNRTLVISPATDDTGG
ncbi:TcpQ domain-containing protein [Azospirillum argentinense]